MMGSLPLPAPAHATGAPAPIECLPADARRRRSAAGRSVVVTTRRCPIGRRFDDGRVVHDRRAGRRARADRRPGTIRSQHRAAANRSGLARRSSRRVVADRRAAARSPFDDEHAHRSLDEVIVDDVPERRARADRRRRCRTGRRRRRGARLAGRIAPPRPADRGNRQARLAAPQLRTLDRCGAAQPARASSRARRTTSTVISSGAMLPRRMPIPARPGLAWMVSDGTFVLAQVAMDHAGDRVRPSRTLVDPPTDSSCGVFPAYLGASTHSTPTLWSVSRLPGCLGRTPLGRGRRRVPTT